jgi:serine/threonine-protein kinase
MKPRTLVLLLSDMKGFTARTSRQTREENARMMALHDALLLPVVRGFGGRKIKGIGDAMLAAFRSPTDSVLCAQAMQDRLAAWNARAGEGDRIEVRIGLSQGEVRKQNGDLHGEPMQLALSANAIADAGEVVLTDAVYLSMAKSEAATEICGERPLPGGGRIRLRRALRGPDPLAPFGGRALRRLGRLPDPARAIRLRVAAERALSFARRRALWTAAGLALLAAAAGESVAPRDSARRAAELVQARQPLAALSELDRIADTPRANDAQVQVVRGKAEQALGQAGPAFADFAAAAQKDPAALDATAIAALVDDLDAETFPPLWRPAVVRLLGEQLGRPAAGAVRRLLVSPRAQSRADALHVLELSGAATDADRLAASGSDLADPHASCAARIEAVRRLALVPEARADSLLSQAASAKACGAAEARDLLRAKGRVTEEN